MRRGAILLLILSLVLVACRASTADTTVVDHPPVATSTPTATTVSEGALEVEEDRQLTAAERELEALEAEMLSTLAELSFLQPEGERLNELFLSYPMTFNFDSGPVTIEKRPERIVSLSASHTEMLYAVGAGDQVVATDLTSNYPAAVDATVKLDSFQFSVEEVAALEPDLVILAFDFQGEAAALTALDIPFLLMGPPENLMVAFGQLSFVGVVTDHRAEAQVVLKDLYLELGRIERAANRIRDHTFYHEVDETLYSATSASFIGDLYRQLGLVNIADAASIDSPFPQLSSEFIVDQNPEFIFLADANFGVTVESVAARPAWDAIAAVTDGNVIELDGDMAGRWGPRTIDLMRAIIEAVEERLR